MTRFRVSPWLALTLALTSARAAAPAPDPAHVFGSDISAEDFAAHVKMLASDDFGGRGVTTDGEAKTLNYLVGQFQRMGLAPGNGDSYFQTVPFQARVGDFAHSTAHVQVNGKATTLAFGPQIVLGSDAGQGDVAVADSPLVFVGYGIDAPDQRWNDYDGIDVKGKTVLVLAGEPTGGATEPALFEGKRLSHYSRWGYKVEAAARHGAVAAIMIHDAKVVGYDWKGVLMRWRSEFALRPEDRPAPSVAVNGFIQGDSAKSLFASAGLSLPELREAAERRGFKAQPLANASFSATLKGKMLAGRTQNIIAKLVGSRFPDEYVLYSAHWDHLGTQAKAPGDNIYNGALDNASGVAAELEIAGKFAARQPRPERSVLFLLPTLEEFGLLGSSYYTRHPLYPLDKTVADINFDMLVPIGRARNFVVIGYGLSELDDVVAPIVASHGRTISAEKASEPDHFFRSDHFSFAKAGVPVLYMRGGVESEGGGRFGAAADETWNHNAAVYHTAKDEFKTDWDLRGVADDIEISYETGLALASSRQWPNYRQGDPYRALRDASRAAAEGH